MSLRVEPVTGADLGAALSALARLRIEVFRAFPYLYDGTLDYEGHYLETFAKSRDAVIVAAYDGSEIVGCATASALDTNHEELITPLRAAGMDLAATYYCGESVLRAEYRGKGLGHAFFDHREASARRHGYARSCFCAVVRPEDHPLRPADYQPHDVFWSKRGYRKTAGLVSSFEWKDVDQPAKTSHPMQFWVHEL